MKPLDQAFAHDWTWNRPRVGRRHWELLSGGECFATIEARSLLGSRMAAVTSAGEREIRHEGWFRGRIRMTDGAGATIATFEPSWFGSGRIVFPGALELKWTRVDFWGRRWAFRDADGHDQVVFARKPSWFRSTTHVEVSDAGRRRPELADLVLAGFYLLLLMQRQAHAAH